MDRKKIVWVVVSAAIIVFLIAIVYRSVTNTGKSEATEMPSQTTEGLYRTLTTDTFADILASHPDDYTIVNVHIPYAGEIEGTDANIPYNDINALASALPDKNAPIILYCRSGRMSKEASEALLKLGYSQVWDVEGGMNAWKASGRKLINE